jgi:hypothetical protein
MIRHPLSYALATATLLLAALGGCANAAPEPVPAARADPSPAATGAPTAWVATGPAPALPTGVDSQDAAAVATAVAAITWTCDTRSDVSPTTASTRATPWLTPKYAALLATQRPSGGATWRELVQHDGKTVADVLDADDPTGPADSTTTSTRTRAITVTPTGRDGWTGPPVHVIATYTLIRADPAGPWAVSTVSADQSISAEGEPDHE